MTEAELSFDEYVDYVPRMQVKMGFIRATKETMYLGRLGFILMWIYRFIWGNRTPIKYRHVFLCVDGLCFDLTTDGLDWWREEDMYQEVWENTEFVPVNATFDPSDLAVVLEQAGTHISRADIIRALLGQEVRGMFCASFAARLLGLDVPLDIEPDSLYAVITMLPGLVDENW